MNRTLRSFYGSFDNEAIEKFIEKADREIMNVIYIILRKILSIY